MSNTGFIKHISTSGQMLSNKEQTIFHMFNKWGCE